MLIKSVKISNLLSFGPDSPALEMKDLNVLIGPNGAGKSNFIEVISLLESSPSILSLPVAFGGGISNWLWKGGNAPHSASVEVIIDYPNGRMDLRHVFAFTESGSKFDLIDEQIENKEPFPGEHRTYFYYKYEYGHPVLNFLNKDNAVERRNLKREEVNPERSILSQRKDPDNYPEITYIGQMYEQIRIFREWSFGRSTPPRNFQKSDLPNDFPQENFDNLGMVLNKLKTKPAIKEQFLKYLRELYDGIDDFGVTIEGGGVQVFFQEGKFVIPATRLSDGTLRYLCLLAILLNPTPPPLICIEEPELGLHPDVIPQIAALLKEASTRTQLVVTTHSDILVDALTTSPEDVIVFEKHDGVTSMKRLDAEALSVWLDKYRLGELWTSGEIGGNRW